MSGTLAYTAGLVPEIADDVEAVDRAMRLGYNWKRGPFELIDEVGADWFADKLAQEGREVPPLLRAAADGDGFYRIADGRADHLAGSGAYTPLTRPDGVLLLSDIKRAGKPLARNGSASLWDIGDGVACLEFHSKMNALDTEIMALVEQSVEIVGERMTALVIHNEGSNFSVGMNLGLALFVVNVGAWPMIEETIKQGQAAFRSLKFAPFPVVGAPSGMALGGGCEVLLHCDAVQAHAESYMGLVEVGVGLVPGWGGCKEMMLRGLTGGRQGFGGAMPAISKVFETIGLAKVSRSAKQAQSLGFLREGDGISANRDRLLADAKARALALAEDYAPPEPTTVKLPGKTGRVALKMAVKGPRQDPQGDRARPGGGGAARQRAHRRRDRCGAGDPGGPPLRAGVRGAARADPHARHHRPHGAHVWRPASRSGTSPQFSTGSGLRRAEGARTRATRCAGFLALTAQEQLEVFYFDEDKTLEAWRVCDWLDIHGHM